MAWAPTVPEPPVKPVVTGWFALLQALSQQTITMTNIATVKGVMAALQSTPLVGAGAVKGFQAAGQSFTVTDASALAGKQAAPQSFSVIDSAILRASVLAGNPLAVTDTSAAVGVVLSAQQISLLSVGGVTGFEGSLAGQSFIPIVDAATVAAAQGAGQSFTITDTAVLRGAPGANQVLAFTESGAVKVISAASISFAITDAGTVYALSIAPQSFSLTNSAAAVQVSTGVSFNAVTTNVTNWSDSLSVSHTAPAGAMIVVDTISSAAKNAPTYGGVAMTHVATVGWTSRYKYIDTAGGTKTASFGFPSFGGAGLVVRSFLNALDMTAVTGSGAGQAVSQSAVVGAGEMAVSILGAKNGSASDAYFDTPAGGTLDANFKDGNRTGMAAMHSDVSTTFTATGNPSYYSGWDSITSVLTSKAVQYDNSAKSAVQSANGGNGTNVVVTHNHTINKSDRTYAIVGVAFYIAFNAMQSTNLSGVQQTVDFGGVTLSYLGSASNNNGDNGGMSFYGGDVSAAGTGTKTVTTTLPLSGSQAGRPYTGQISSYTYTSVGQIGKLKTNFANPSTLAVETKAGVGRRVFGMISQYSGSAFTAFSLTQRQIDDGGAAWIGGDTESDTATETVTGTYSGGFGTASYGFDMRPVGGEIQPPSVVGATAVQSTSITIPTHQVGDIIVIYAYRGGSNTIPSKPAASGTVPAWVDIDAVTGANTNSSRVAYFVATATTTTSGTWANAGSMVCVVLRGQYSTPIGGHLESGSTRIGGAIAPAITLTNADGTSALLHFFGCSTATGFSAWDAAPTGYTQRAADKTVGFAGTCLDTKNSTTSDGAVTQTHNGTASASYRGATVEIRAQ